VLSTVVIKKLGLKGCRKKVLQIIAVNCISLIEQIDRFQDDSIPCYRTSGFAILLLHKSFHFYSYPNLAVSLFLVILLIQDAE